MIKRVKWSPRAVALVSEDGSRWRGAGTTTATVYGFDTDRSGRLWLDGDTAIEDEDAWTLPHPGRCVTCQASSPCGCPGEGWSVPVHVRVPDPVPDGYLLNPISGDVAAWEHNGIWCHAYYGDDVVVGSECRPLIPIKDGRPVWVDLWEAADG